MNPARSGRVRTPRLTSDWASRAETGGRVAVRLDQVRALAALAVVIGHVRGLFFSPWSDVHHPSPAARVFYLVTGFGHEAVMVFFVLSGLLVGLSVLRSLAGGYWSWRWYLSRRLTRLLIVLLPALLLGLLFDRVGLLLYPDGIYGGNAVPYVIGFPVADRLHGVAFLGNAAFLQGIAVAPFGSNGPLWSLSFEFWYYLLFPLLLLALVGGSLKLRVVNALLAGLTVWFIGPELASYFLFWLLGVAVGLAPRVRLVERRWLLGLLGCALMGAALLLARTRYWPPFASDGAVAITFAICLYQILHAGAPGRVQSVADRRLGPASQLASFSYTLYLVHLPPLVLIAATVSAGGGTFWKPDALHLAIAIAIVASVVAYARAIAQLTERRTDALRAEVDRLLASSWARAFG